MKWKFKILLLILAIIIFGAVLVCAERNKVEEKKIIEQGYLRITYFSEKQFNKSRQIADSFTAGFPQEKILGGIIPHDTRHGEYIAHFFKNLKKQEPETILLIGPNHKEIGNGKIITASNSWYTPFGILEANQEIIKQLVEKGIVSENKLVIEQEHSIYGLVPFISYYLPQTKVVPLIFKSGFSISDIENLTSSLADILPKSIVIVAAVDFSHYLTSSQAEEKDKVTAKAMAEFDYQKILSFGERFNDYVDSPPSIAFLMLWMQKQGVKNIEILANTNSGKLEHRENEPVTSYFETVYY